MIAIRINGQIQKVLGLEALWAAALRWERLHACCCAEAERGDGAAALAAVRAWAPEDNLNVDWIGCI